MLPNFLDGKFNILSFISSSPKILSSITDENKFSTVRKVPGIFFPLHILSVRLN